MEEHAFGFWARRATSLLGGNLEIPSRAISPLTPVSQLTTFKGHSTQRTGRTAHLPTTHDSQSTSGETRQRVHTSQPARSGAAATLQHFEGLLASRPRSRVLPKSQLCSRYLLLHISGEEAFHGLQCPMFDRGLQKQYGPDMILYRCECTRS